MVSTDGHTKPGPNTSADSTSAISESGPGGSTFASLYALLAQPFEAEFHDVRGGVDVTYLTGEQVVSRLNRQLGFEAWSFRVLEHGIDATADEAWVLGELRLHAGDAADPVVRQQFGSQKLKRSRSSGAPLDLGFDLKGAATDALKKCATLIGVGLYLARKEEPERPAAGVRQEVPAGRPRPPEGGLSCAECAAALGETRFKDGTSWTPEVLADHGRRNHGRVLCMRDYKSAQRAKAAHQPAAPSPSAPSASR